MPAPAIRPWAWAVARSARAAWLPAHHGALPARTAGEKRTAAPSYSPAPASPDLLERRDFCAQAPR
ncbi:hypothetical protein, partial [Acidovorax delafieldii]|uniref:hypothetical protein n=1 Tax=Acidovorax delafieldii TaxID=47920 RepID=UPI001E50F835